MKRLLLSLAFMGAVLLGNAQVILNELYTDPGKNNSEFFELTNTGITPVKLDCYTLISFYASGSNKGFYVIDIPNLSVSGRSYFTGAAASPFTYQGNTASSSFNWNNPGATGSIRKYAVNNAGTGYDVTTVPNNEQNDLFRTITGQEAGGAKYAVFLFNQSNYINGFMGGYGSSSVPSQITSMPVMTITPNADPLSNCGTTYTINWSNIKTTEFSGEAAGNDNGFARKGDGYCGLWDKTSNQVNHTPNAANPATGTTNPSATLTTTQRIICGTRIDFTISNPLTSSVYPVEVQLYEDKGTIGNLDIADIYITSYSPSITGGSTNIYSFFNLDPTKTYLLVYRTALGCIDRIAKPDIVTGSITTTAKSYCGLRVDFDITAANGGASTYSYPITVELHYDLDKDGVIDAGDLNSSGTLDPADEDYVVASQVVNSASATIFSFTNLDPTQNVLLVYKSAFSCFLPAPLKPVAVAGNILPEVLSYCGRTIEYTVRPGDLAATKAYEYIFPVTVELYYDVNGNGAIDAEAGESVQQTDIAESLSDLSGIFTNVDPAFAPLLLFKSAYNCYMPLVPVKPFERGGTINPVAYSYCGQQVDFRIPTGSPGSLKYAFPVTVELYYDLDADGVIDEGAEETIIGTRLVNSASETLFSFTNLEPAYQVLLVFKPANADYSCYMPPIPLRPTPIVGSYTTTETIYCDKEIDVTITGAFGPTGPLDQNGQVVNAPIYTQYAVPVGVSLYYDINNNGTLEVGVDRKDVESDSLQSVSGALLSFNVDAGFENAKKFVVYSSRTSCFYKVVEITGTPVAQAIASSQVEEKNIDPANVSTKSYTTFDIISALDASITTADFPIKVDVYSHPELEQPANLQDYLVATKEIAAVGDEKHTVELDTRGDYVTLKYYSARGCLLRSVTLVAEIQAPLPVKFASFTAARNKTNKQQVEVSWTTAQEQNNKGFYLQRKTGNEWKEVAFVFSAAEGGNSSEALTYRFKDANTHPGVSQYRLLQVDLDGKATYSNIVSLMGETPKSSVVVYPNPAVGGNVNLVFADAESAKQVLVSDLSGRVVQQARNITTASHAITGLKTGFYTIKVTNTKTGETTVEKIIVP